jgi:hypothetical protein
MDTRPLKSLLLISALLVPSATHAQQEPLPSRKVRPTFIKECVSLGKAIPDLSLPCVDFARGRSVATLRDYLGLVQTAKKALMTAGPQMAQEMLKSCLGNATRNKPDPGGLLFCLGLGKFQHIDLERLAKGKGSLNDYGKLAQATRKEVPVYPDENSPQAESQRATIRKELVYGCVAKESGYVQVLCSAVAVNEAFARRPFRDNGELAKAFDKVVQVYAITEAPRVAIQSEAKEILQRAGINDQVATAITNPQEGAVEAGKHVASEAEKIYKKVVPQIDLSKVFHF